MSNICQTCGMVCRTPTEYHPYAACLMFKACHDGDTVRANLDAVRATPAPGAPGQEAAVSWQVRRTDGSPLACWETCTKDLYDLTLSTGRYCGFENGPPCEVRALGVIAAQEAAAVQAVGAWINVDEQLPEEGTTVACCAGGTPYLAYLIFGKDASGEWVQTWTQDGEPEQQPRHWTPLPAPPAALPAGITLKGDEAP